MTRSEFFANLCNQRKIHGAVEIGTDRADFAVEFLKRWDGHSFWCVDPYEPYGEMPWSREPDMLMACQRLAPFVPRVKIVRSSSVKVAQAIDFRNWFPLGFVYIDGCHECESVKADLEAWWPKLLAGGILAGHDYAAPWPGVVRAVDEFAAKHALKVNVIDDQPPSWWIEKP